jgi:hypothetical protein
MIFDDELERSFQENGRPEANPKVGPLSLQIWIKKCRMTLWAEEESDNACPKVFYLSATSLPKLVLVTS